ncbi:MAG: phytanoyl-CoA dioxygenase family protein, partial [Paenibacillus sp.]|nr:phytanoyl-CoA dioxygenase family protein [Paenibacillus sp.]
MSFETANILTITEEQLQHFNEHGYIRFDNLFKEEEIDPIRAIIDLMDEQSEQAIKNQGSADAISAAGKINFTSQLNFMHPDLQRFAADARFVALNTALLGPDVQLYWDQSVYKRPERTREFPWHQDNGYGPIEPMMYVTCWLAL